MIENKKSIDDIAKMDDLARIPNDYKPMSLAEREKAGLTVKIWREKGVKVVTGGSNTTRGQRRYTQRQWQDWWSSSGSSWSWGR